MRFWLLLIFCLAGCANNSDRCGDKFLALWPTSDGQYDFQEVKLPTLSNPYELKGSVAQIFYEAGISQGGFKGSVAQPKFTRANGVCVPMDTASSLGVTLYAQFEKLKLFEDSTGISNLIDWPRKVGFDIHLRSAEGMVHNNAHYISMGDAIVVPPYSLSGMPLAGNHGIMAHELFHAHFQRSVVIPVNTSLAALPNIDDLFYMPIRPSVEDVQNVDLSKPRGLNAFILRAWNEGLADLFAAIYTKNPKFIGDSLPAVLKARSLDLPSARVLERNRFTEVARQITKTEHLVGLSYDQGAKLSRVLYRIATSGLETQEEFLVRMMSRLNDISPAITKDYDTQVLNFEQLLPIMLKDMPLKKANCKELSEVVSDATTMSGIPQCFGTLSI